MVTSSVTPEIRKMPEILSANAVPFYIRALSACKSEYLLDRGILALRGH